MDERRGDTAASAETDTGGHALKCTPATPEDRQWLVDQSQQRPGGRLILRLDDEQDVSGHQAEDLTLVRIVVQDDEMDTEGHAISIRLPSPAEADAFRRKLLLTGVLVGTVLLGGAGIALAASQDSGAVPDQAASQIESAQAIPLPGPAPTRADQSAEDVSYEDATPNDAMV